MTQHHDFIGDESTPVMDNSPETLLSELEAELSTPIQKEELWLTIPNRPHMQLAFDPTFDYDEYKSWVKKCRESKKSDEVDHFRLAMIVMSHTTRGMSLNGKERFTEKGERLPLNSVAVHKMLKAPEGGTQIAIKKLFGSDGHVVQAMTKIVEKAGYSVDDVEEFDPLDR